MTVIRMQGILFVQYIIDSVNIFDSTEKYMKVRRSIFELPHVHFWAGENEQTFIVWPDGNVCILLELDITTQARTCTRRDMPKSCLICVTERNTR